MQDKKLHILNLNHECVYIYIYMYVMYSTELIDWHLLSIRSLRGAMS